MPPAANYAWNPRPPATPPNPRVRYRTGIRRSADKIFRLYFTTKQKGSGIGLAMAFRIVQLHDGTIDFTSEPGKARRFHPPAIAA